MTPEDKTAYVLKLGYQNAQGANSFEDLILYLKDYAEYIESLPELRSIADALRAEKNKLLKEMQITEAKALEELNKAKDYLLKYAKEEKIEPTEFIKRGVAGLKDYEAGRIQMAGIKSDHINNFLFEIIQDFSEEDKKRVFKKYGVKNPKRPNTYDNYSFSSSLIKRRRLSVAYKSKRAIEVWGCWDFISLVPKYAPFLHSDDMRLFYEAKFNYLDEGIISEYVNMMMLGRKEHTINNNKEISEFISNYKRYTARFYFYANRELVLPVNKIEKKNIEDLDDEAFQVSVSGGQKLLIKNNMGDYLYDSKRIEVAKKTIYYDVFDILFLNNDQDGFLSYEDIEKKLVKKGHASLEDKTKRNKRILNAISDSQGFFKLAKINGHKFKNKTLDGMLLVRNDGGKGLRLNNPIIQNTKS